MLLAVARKTATEAIQQQKVSSSITIPHLFSPRSYQIDPMRYIEAGGKRAVTVWHRRAGKDLTWLNVIICEMIRRPFCGTYLAIYPKLTQGRRDCWDAKTSQDSGGRPFRACFPPELVMESSETEMQITLKPMPHQRPHPIPDGRGGRKMVGSIFQVMGTDRDSIENLRGINCAGAVFSEYAEQNREAWELIIQPVLAENGGWAAFDFTPKGKNHAYDLYQMAKSNPSWFSSLLTIDDTRRNAPGEDGSHIVSPEYIEQIRAEGIPEEVIQQEYYCDFSGFLKGTIYGDLIVAARKDNRITRVPCHTSYPVGACFDIGRSDGTAIWLYQRIGQEIRFIDYIEDQGKGADFYAHVLQNQKPYMLSRLILPWDAKMKGYSASLSTEEYFQKVLCRRVDIAEKCSIQTGIDMVRRCFSRMFFDEVKCAPGLIHLENYKRKWDDDKNDYSGDPIHDNHSHAADGIRCGIVGGMDEPFEFMQNSSVPIVQDTEFTVFQ